MKTPTNAAARDILARKSIIADIDEQIRVLRETQLEHSEIIGSLGAIATWADTPTEPEPELPPEEPIVNPEPEPEPEPETPTDRNNHDIQ